MSNSWEDRERALEEGYFIQKDHELVAKMKARLAAEKHPNDYQCPKCGGHWHTGNFENVQVDVCDKCGGVWFDAGEVQKIAGKTDKSWLERLFS
jgi:uncharacterized protein